MGFGFARSIGGVRYQTAARSGRHTSVPKFTEIRIRAKLEALARSTKRSKSYLAAEAIAAYLALNEWQIAEIETGMTELDNGQIVSEEEAAKRYDQLLKPR